MAYNVKDIHSLVNASAKDALGKTAGVTQLDTTNFVSLGKQLEDLNLLEGFFGALANRIVKTAYFVRTYKAKTRKILRDEHEYGAFIQKVYYKMPDAVEDPAYEIPDSGTYAQQSPYDVEGTVEVSAQIFGAQGSWSYEILRPLVQIKSAFLSEAAMMAFIDGIYVQINNRMALDQERLVALAANTAMGSALAGGGSRNLLAEYNELNPGATLTVAQAMTSAEFLRFAAKEISDTIKQMGAMGTVYNRKGAETFTDKDHMVVEVLGKFASASNTYLQADTYHKEMVALPGYDEIAFWQSSGKNYAFGDVSKISVTNDGLKDDFNETGAVEQDGIICFVHDDEAVAAYFGERRTWELVNPRSDVVVHGEKARKGFAVDDHANSIVFYLAPAGSFTVPTGDHFTATASTETVIRGREIVLTIEPDATYEVTSVTYLGVELEPNTDGTYSIIPVSDADIDAGDVEITVET